MAEKLLDLRDRPFEILVELESRLQTARLEVGSGGVSQLWAGLGFRLGQNWLAAPREEVREVIQPPPMTRVPGARPWLLGVANVRGSLLPVCDVHRLLGGEPVAPQRSSRVLVFNSERIPAGFLVDEVVGYRQFTPNEQRPELLRDIGALKPVLLGAFAHEGQPWLALSLHRLTRSAAFRQAGW